MDWLVRNLRDAVIVIAVVASGVLWAISFTQARRQTERIRATPGLLTDSERAIMETASLDQANHVVMAVRARRRAELAAFVERHAANGARWTMTTPTGVAVAVEARQPGDFAQLVTADRVDWDWDPSAHRLAVWRHRRRVRAVPPTACFFTPAPRP